MMSSTSFSASVPGASSGIVVWMRVNNDAMSLFSHWVRNGSPQSSAPIVPPSWHEAHLPSYDGKCASCHDGGTMGAELWGDPFLTQWENKDIASLFTRIQTTMPEDAPGTLAEKEVLDIIAYVIQTNGFPA